MVSQCELEFDSPTNGNWYFAPLRQVVRGRFDFMRCNEPTARVAMTRWAPVVPAQRLGLSKDGTGYIREPLHEHAELKSKIEQRGLKLPPQEQEFADVDVCTWAFWMRRAVDSGIAKVVSGKLPEVEGDPQIDFIRGKRDSNADKLTAVLERLADLLEKKLG